jgi:hypothetical protein
MKKIRAFTGVEIVAVIAVLGIAGWIFVPKVMHGASRRAANSTNATAQVEQAVNAQGAAAAASVVKMAEANSAAPASPSRDFIAQEAPVALSRLPAPDPQALLEAERRKSAVMEGRAEEARKLYEAAAKQSAELQRERDEAIAARRQADAALEQAAAAEHASKVQRLGLAAIALILGAGWLYAKIYGIGPKTIGAIAADIRAGDSPLAALDANLGPRLHARVKKAAKLAARE